MILFMDAHQHLDMEMTAIRRHPLVLKNREKSFVYNEQDQPWCAMPGLYAGCPQRRSTRSASGPARIYNAQQPRHLADAGDEAGACCFLSWAAGATGCGNASNG